MKMRRMISIVLVLALAMTLAACGGSAATKMTMGTGGTSGTYYAYGGVLSKYMIDAIVAMGSAVNGAINSVTTLVLFAVVPFNLLKGILVSFITFLLYKRISPILHKNDARKMQKKITKEM